MDDEFDTSVDTSFDDVSSDFSEPSGFDTSFDVGEIMDDSSFDVSDGFEESDFSEYDDSSSDVGELMDEPSDDFVETSDIADVGSDVIEDYGEDIESLMDDVSDDELAETSDVPTDTDFNVESDIVDLMDEAALETTDETADIAEDDLGPTDEVAELMDEDTSDLVEGDIESLDEVDSSDMETEGTDDIESLMDTADEEVSDTLEESETEILEVIDNTENLNVETIDENIDNVTENADDGPQKVLKRDEFELLSAGNRNINDILDVKADDYRDKGFTDEEIARKLEDDKIALQKEFLNDAFPGQDVSPAVFNGFEENRPRTPSVSEISDIFERDLDLGEDSTDAIGDVGRIMDDSDIVDDISPEKVDYYAATPISDIPIVQEDGTVDNLENIMNDLENTEDVPSSDLSSDMNEELNEIPEIEAIENIDGWLKDINPNFDEFDVDSPYCNNCGSCAYAVYQRLEGNNDICATAENIGYNSEMEALTGMEQVSMSPQEIEERLLSEGNGAHAIIGIDRAEGPGHWFNAACIDGKVVTIDGQDGSISGWPPDYGDVVNWEMSVRKETK